MLINPIQKIQAKQNIVAHAKSYTGGQYQRLKNKSGEHMHQTSHTESRYLNFHYPKIFIDIQSSRTTKDSDKLTLPRE